MSLLVLALVLGLLGAVGFLMSERNQRRFRLHTQIVSPDETLLIVERGRFFPIGYEPYIPDAKDVRMAYAPIPIPPDEKVLADQLFDDRVELDRSLFLDLSAWAKKRLDSRNEADFDLASSYVQRCSMLPSLSEEQRQELKSLRADLAYRNGRRLASAIAVDLDKATAEFKLSLELGTNRPTDASDWARTMEQQAEAYHNAINARSQPRAESDVRSQAAPEAPKTNGEPL
jgi:hypothetical protein